MVTRVIPGEVVVIKAAYKKYILAEKNFLYKTKIQFPELTFLNLYYVRFTSTRTLTHEVNTKNNLQPHLDFKFYLFQYPNI